MFKKEKKQEAKVEVKEQIKVDTVSEESILFSDENTIKLAFKTIKDALKSGQITDKEGRKLYSNEIVLGANKNQIYNPHFFDQYNRYYYFGGTSPEEVLIKNKEQIEEESQRNLQKQINEAQKAIQEKSALIEKLSKEVASLKGTS